MNNKVLCEEEHICDRCRQPTKCGTYVWACPWINDDEDQMCDPCILAVEVEMREWEYEVSGKIR